KIEEINNFQQEPDESLYRAWERFKELLMKCPQHYLTNMQEVILFYNGLDVPTRQILDSKAAIPSKTATNAKIAIQEMADSLRNGTMEHLQGLEDTDEGKSHAGTLVDIPVFVKNFAIITGFTIIDDDVTKGVELDMIFCKKYMSCQVIMKKFAHGDRYD
nr:hypothetical protein [Tanacetum cinerariifolium]